MTDQEKFKELDNEANRAYTDIEAARDWIDSLKDKAIFPDSWESISAECDNLLDEITCLVSTEKTELEKKEQS